MVVYIRRLLRIENKAISAVLMRSLRKMMVFALKVEEWPGRMNFLVR